MISGLDISKKIKELQLPLIRLKIEITGFPVLKSKKINDYFQNKVANASDFLYFYKKNGFMSSVH